MTESEEELKSLLMKVKEKRSEEHTSELQSPSAVILEPNKIKSATVSTVSPSICHDVMGPDAMILVFNPLDEVLKKAYDQIDSGRPAIIYTSGTYATTVTDKPQDRSASEHFVLLIGFKKNADRNDLKPSDFYGIDPANAYKSTERNYIPWVTLTDTAPAKMLEEYALFVAVDQSAHVKTCIAHADSVRWDTSLSFPINPDYVQES